MCPEIELNCQKRESEVEQLLDSIVTLPTLPAVVTKITAIIDDPDSSINDVARLIAKDPPLAMKVLRLVNSAFYGMRNPVSSIAHAASLLGVNVLKNLVLTANICKAFGGLKGKQLFDRDAFWYHSVATGLLAKVMIRHSKKRSRSDPEEVFAAGLLHDIGKVILEQFLTDEFINIMNISEEEGISFYNAERRAECLSHSEIGAGLAERWKIPDPLVEAIRFHHAPLSGSSPSLMACVVSLADDCLHQMEKGPASPWALNPDILHAIELNPSASGEIRADFEEAMGDGELVEILTG